MKKYQDGCYDTTKGIALIAKVLAGQGTMNYTRAAVGKGNLTDDQDPKTMEEPADYVMDAKITAVTIPVDGECQITVQISSKDVSEGFYCTGIVLYAEDPDDGEVPFTYMVLENEPEYIRPSDAIVGKLATFDIIAAVGAVDTVTATIDPTGIATVENVKTMIEFHDKSNASHPDLQAPSFTEAAVRENIESGETVSTLFGKIKKWFADLKPVAFTGKYGDLTDRPTIPKTAADVGALPISGGTLTGNLKVGTGNNTLDVGSKLQLRTDGEGGNITITPPNNYTSVASKWEMDAYNGNFRIIRFKDGAAGIHPLIINADGSGTFTGKAKAPMVTEISLSQDIALLPSGFYHVEGIITGNNYPPGIKDHYWGIYMIVMVKEEYKDMNVDDVTDLRILSVQNGELYFGARNHSKTLVWNKIGLTRV